MIDHHQRLAFSEGIKVGEDLEFQYKYLSRCQHPVRLNVVLYNYRIREDSATQGLEYRSYNKTAKTWPPAAQVHRRIQFLHLYF